VEIQIKDNPFVKVSSTTKMYYLVEKTTNLIRLRVRSRASDVPYCDSFGVEEEMLIVMP
jgi:hypothetical protein